MIGCLAALSRFILRLGEWGLPLYRLLKNSECFEWTSEAKDALWGLKDLRSRVPVLIPSVEGEPLLLYIVATTQIVSVVVVVERQEPGHTQKVQCPVYFVSKVLSDAKTHYPHIQKLMYTVLIAKRKLLHYFESHPVTVVTSFPLGEII